jgi:hypothetical protein
MLLLQHVVLIGHKHIPAMNRLKAPMNKRRSKKNKAAETVV